jgi:phage major head subunit gpT-like protein
LRQQINQENAASGNNDDANPDAIAISKNGVYMQTAAAYLLTTAAVLGYLVYQNRRSNVQMESFVGRI